VEERKEKCWWGDRGRYWGRLWGQEEKV